MADDNSHPRAWLATAAYLLQILNRRWFGGIFADEGQIYLVRLLLGVVVSYDRGVLPTKKQALEYMHASDGRTAQRYIRRAEEMGLLRVERSRLDKRASYLVPTEGLLGLVKAEMQELGRQGRLAAAILIEGRLPADAADADMQAIFASDDDIHGLLTDMRMSQIPMTPRYKADIYSETIRLAPRNVEAYLKRARIFEDLGEHAKALADLNAAVDISPTSGPLWSRAHFHIDRGADEKALADLARLASVSQSPGSLRALAECLQRLGQHQAAIERFSAAIALIKTEQDIRIEMPRCLLGRGRSYQLLGRKEAAARDFAEAKEAAPDSDYIKQEIQQYQSEPMPRGNRKKPPKKSGG